MNSFLSIIVLISAIFTTNSSNQAVAVKAPPPMVVSTVVNVAPIVSAGSDQTIKLPNPVTLNGTVSDDGLPGGQTITYLWTLLSTVGTSTAAISCSTCLSTSVNFTGPGAFKFLLTASDTLLLGTSTVTVTVSPADPPKNLTPLVSAGADRVLKWPEHSVSLYGSANDDHLPVGSHLTYLWTADGSNPATTTMNCTTCTTVNLNFYQIGRYKFYLSVSDGELNNSAFAIVQVDPEDQVQDPIPHFEIPDVYQYSPSPIFSPPQPVYIPEPVVEQVPIYIAPRSIFPKKKISTQTRAQTIRKNLKSYAGNLLPSIPSKTSVKVENKTAMKVIQDGTVNIFNRILNGVESLVAPK